jgi:hypothetical protein
MRFPGQQAGLIAVTDTSASDLDALRRNAIHGFQED